MGASDLTTEIPGTGSGEVADGDRPSAAGGPNGHVAKKRRRLKALSTAVANGNGRVAAAAPAGAVVADEPPVEPPPADEAAVELPVVEELDGEEEASPAHEEPGLRGRRAARRAEATRRATPAGRRAELVATAATINAATAEAETAAPAATSARGAKIVRRAVALAAILMIPASVYALVVTDGPATSLSRADASYLSAQLITADQRVRTQLVRVRQRQTSAALARTRDASLTARSIALELGNSGGADAKLLRRALTLEAAWLDAVGSVLSNPRSALRAELVARDAALRPALDALPAPEGRRKGGAPQLVRYAQARIAAATRGQ